MLLDESLLSILIASLSMKVCKSLLDSSEADGVWQFCSWFCLRQPQTQSNSVEVRTLPLLISLKLTEWVTLSVFSRGNWPLVPQWTSLAKLIVWKWCLFFPPPPLHTPFVWSPHVITVSVLCTQSLGSSQGPQSMASNRWPVPLFACRFIRRECLQLLSLHGRG